MSELELEFDQTIDKFFIRGNIEVKKNDKWDYVIVSYLLKGDLVHQEQLMSDDFMEEFDSGLNEAVDEYSDNVDKFSDDVDSLEEQCKRDGDVAPEEELLLKQIKATSGVSESIDEESSEDDGIKPEEKLLYKQIKATAAAVKSPPPTPSGTGMHIPGEKSDTGDDLSRTGPGGLNPQDNNDATHYEGQSDTKLNVATAIEIIPDIAKQVYDIDGTIPELREGIEIKIEDDRVEIKIDDESQEEFKKPVIPKELDLDKDAGRLHPGTHVNTIKAGELGIADLIPISSLWKEKGDAIDPGVEMKEFSFNESMDDIEPSFEHSSSFIGKARYFPRSQQMALIINGKNYDFCGFSHRDFDSFAGAPSKGVHFNLFIKKQFNCSIGFNEALNIHKDRQAGEFDWIDDEAINEMMKYAQEHGSGKFMLAVLSGETITDHRIEGTEQQRRRWTTNELIQNIRTAKGKMIDINHLYPKTDMQSGGVYDANWNFTTNKGEVIIWETDQDILNAIRNDIIQCVSIHTGLPRKVNTNCDDGECFLEPSGTILGEEDNIALAYVVTDPDGFNYNGQIIPAMPPGMDFTKIYLVE